MAEKTWEGRGDKLADARMSWIAGRAADDLRLASVHMRILLHLGRQNHRRGWLRISQSELARQWSVSRQAVNGAISQLVDWGYVLKRNQAATRESFCTYKIRLDDPEDYGVGVSSTVDTPQGGGVSSTVDTSVKQGATPLSSPDDTPPLIPRARTDYRRLSPNSPPPPPTAGGQPVHGVGEIRLMIDWIEDLRSEGAAPHVLDGLLAPLIEGGLAPWKSADNAKLDPRGPGRQICADMAADPAEVVAHVLAAVRAVAKYRLPPLHDLRSMLATARSEHERRHVRDRELAALPAVPALGPETQAYVEALAQCCQPEQMTAWFEPMCVAVLTHAAGWPRVRVATRHRPGLLSQSVGSQARAAARLLWGQDVEVDFIQGRPAEAIGREAAE